VSGISVSGLMSVNPVYQFHVNGDEIMWTKAKAKHTIRRDYGRQQFSLQFVHLYLLQSNGIHIHS